MQHERFFLLAHQAVDDLRIAPGAQGGDHQRLGFAAGKQRRAVSSRQYTGADVDGAHGLGVAPVDARLAVENLFAHQPIFQIGEFGADLLGGKFRRSARIGFRQRFDRGGLDFLDLRVALLFFGDCVGGGDIRFGELGDCCLQFLVRFRRGPCPFRLAGFRRKFIDGLDGDLHLFVSERHRAEHHFFIEAVGLRFHHQHAFRGAGNHQVELARCANCEVVGFRMYLPSM